MKIKDGFVVRPVGKEVYAVAVFGAALETKGMVRLNKTGEFLWKLLEKDCSEEQLTAALMEKYAIDEATARRDCGAFLTMLREADLLV